MLIQDLDLNTRSFILETYLRQASMAFKHKSYAKKIEIECIYCNSGPYKLKGTLFKADSGRWCYICWRAACPCANHGISAEKWLKKANPVLYKNYVEALKRECNKDVIDKYQKKAEQARIKAEEQEKKEIEEKIREDNEATRFFKPICIPGKNQKRALEYCKKRKIPEECYKKFFYCDEGKYKNRLIIPFYTRNGTITFFQGRALRENDEVKYLSRVGKTALFDIDFVDKEKPLVILEGPIDSMFIENSTATVGAGSSSDLDADLKEYKRYWLYDNDEAGNRKAGVKVRNKEFVFLWKKFFMDYNIDPKKAKIKDINDLVIHLNKNEKFKFEELKNYFSNNKNEFLMYL